MSDFLSTVDGSTQVGLVKALECAAAGGQTSTAETLLGAIAGRDPQGATAAAIRALNIANYCRRWGAVSYLADYLEETAPPPVGGGTSHVVAGTAEVLRCLAEHRGGSPRGEPFLLTDAIEETHLQTAPPPIEFEHVDGGLPADVYGGVNNPCRHFSLANPDRSMETLLGGGDTVMEPGEIELILSAPPEARGGYTVEITAGSRREVAQAVVDTYRGALAGSAHALADFDLARVVTAPQSSRRRAYAVEVAS